MTENINGTPQHAAQPAPQQPKKKARKWPWIVGAVVVLGAIGAAAGGGKAPATTAAPASAAAAAVETESAEEAAAREKAEAEQRAAEEKAEAERQAAAEKAEREREAEEKKRKAKAKAAEKARINNATEVSARQLSKINKNPDNYTGDTLVVYGQITQFDAATGQCTFRADISNTVMAYDFEYEYNSIFTSGDGDSDCPKLEDVVEDDVVRMTVTSMGSFSYDTQIGGNTTVPMFKVEKISRL